MPNQLIADQQLPAEISSLFRFFQPVEQMSLRAIVIPAAHIVIQFVQNPLLRNRSYRM